MSNFFFYTVSDVCTQEKLGFGFGFGFGLGFGYIYPTQNPNPKVFLGKTSAPSYNFKIFIPSDVIVNVHYL
jgi:hypothetical protein